MKYTVWLSLALMTGFFAQVSSPAVLAKPTASVTAYQPDPTPAKNKKMPKGERLNTSTGMDTTTPKNRKQRRLNPDSLRRGGATKVDTVRR